MKNKAGEFILPNFKVYCKATIIKIVWCWHKNGHTESTYKIHYRPIGQNQKCRNRAFNFCTIYFHPLEAERIDFSTNGVKL